MLCLHVNDARRQPRIQTDKRGKYLYLKVRELYRQNHTLQFLLCDYKAAQIEVTWFLHIITTTDYKIKLDFCMMQENLLQHI